MNTKSFAMLAVLFSAVILVGAGCKDSTKSDDTSTKIYIDNEFRDFNTSRTSYLGSFAPMIVFMHPSSEKFIGYNLKGEEVVLDTPKIHFNYVSSVVFDANSDLIYYKFHDYIPGRNDRIISIQKMDVTHKTISTIVGPVSGEVEYADRNSLLINDGVFQLYDPHTGVRLQPQNSVHVADSGEYKMEYRIVNNNIVYQIVFDNKGGVVRTGRYQGFQASSDAMKVHFNKIGTLNREYITKNNITPYNYLRSVYDDQDNTKLYYTQTTGDIWPTSNAQPKLVLHPVHPVFAHDYFFTYYTMGNLYDIGSGQYAQVIGDGLVIFDASDMSVRFTKSKSEIESILLNKWVIALPDNHIENPKTIAACRAMINPSVPNQGVVELDTSADDLRKPNLRSFKEWPDFRFAYCLR